METESEPNAQNSELDPKKHPSGARIEKMMNDQKAESGAAANIANEKGLFGETLRPSEREDTPANISSGHRDSSAAQQK